MKNLDYDSNNGEFLIDLAQEQIIAKLLESRIHFLSGDIDEGKSKDTVSKLIALDFMDPKKDILFYIDSYGGDVYSLIAIHDAMKMLRCDIATICIGKAMSAAAILLLAGTQGKRFITPNSRIMIHEISSGDEGKLSYMRDHLAEAEKLQTLIALLVKQYTKMPPKQISEVFQKDFYLDAKTAKKFGVVDHIINHPDDLHKKIHIE